MKKESMLSEVKASSIKENKELKEINAIEMQIAQKMLRDTCVDLVATKYLSKDND